MAIPLVLFVLLFTLKHISCFLGISPEIKEKCPTLEDHVWRGHPKKQLDAGTFLKFHNVTSLGQCVEECCLHLRCNVVFMHETSCFGIQCHSSEDCMPINDATEGNGEDEFDQMVIVRPPLNQLDMISDFDKTADGTEDLMMEGSDLVGVRCPCPRNEICLADGTCECKPGFTRRSAYGGLCTQDYISISDPLIKETIKPVTALIPKMYSGELDDKGRQEPFPTKLMVSVRSKDIRLPENEVVLHAFVVPSEEGKKIYSYKWDTLVKPEDSGGTTNEVKENTLRLSHLTEGFYTFRVTVMGPNNSSGQAVANVTVLPQNRENKPPVALVRPIFQTVKLPNSMAVLDASGSHDDDGIVKFIWELQEGPLGYQLNLTDSETLLLRNLQKPGNYTFRLTVTDTDGATNSTRAQVSVLEAPDYPPVSNAGPSMVLYLPKNNVTLNGTLSSDDKGIVTWEWTKSPSDHDKAVDMQNTHTPYLQLSHLTEGMYTFVLKVTDNSGQSSSSETIVLVKPPTNKPPVAEAGLNLTVPLPQTWAVLNGSSSSDDISISEWKWQQLSGPNVAVLLNFNESVTNVTGLTKGVYQFQLTVTDSSGNTASDNTFIQVTQSINVGPVADAGGDQTLIMPVDVLIVNGSRSRDDLRIVTWQWTREPTSLAIGTIINHSDKTPVLMLTNIVTGRYEFRLRVTDDQGEFSEDTVSIIVKPDVELLSLVELTLNIDSRQLMESQKDSVLAKLGLLLREASQLVVRELTTEAPTGRASLVFYGQGHSGAALPGPSVVATLKTSLSRDPSLLLPLSVSSLRTLVCQNNCSGHGVCVQSTRACLCEAFWMEDLFNKYFGDGESNCDWSILYVLIGLVVGVVLFVLIGWAISCLIQKICCPRQNQTHSNKYSLLDSTEQVKLQMSKVVVSEYSEETDSDVLFETSRQGNPSKSQRSKIFRNGHKPDRHSRVKT